MPMISHPQVHWVSCDRLGPTLFVCRCSVCGAHQDGPVPAHVADIFARAHSVHQSGSPTHLGLGDMVAKATSALGIKPCTPCEKRRAQLNGIAPRFWKR